jgi:hypothetical protein
VLSPADSKAVVYIRLREPLYRMCGSAKKWISCVKGRCVFMRLCREVRARLLNFATGSGRR